MEDHGKTPVQRPGLTMLADTRPLRLAAFVLLLSGGYYGVVAFFPQWLTPQLFGLPCSILVGLAIFAAGAAISLLYAFAPVAPERMPPPSPRGEDS